MEHDPISSCNHGTLKSGLSWAGLLGDSTADALHSLGVLVIKQYEYRCDSTGLQRTWA